MAGDGAVLDTVFDALANERRREIVVRLARGSMTTPEIGRHFGFTKQALSRHVGLLESAGLVSRTRRGRVDEVTLVPRQLDDLVSWVNELRRGWTASLDRLDEVLNVRNQRDDGD
ncbi:MAG TPA: metalloregulator ArsR/SmtB family transcription factor [Pseudonocardiaceae bacterium]|nr:metalloregulator ArsR/SmtB family transcription factor [Pseudonocardiaceae bacterium]